MGVHIAVDGGDVFWGGTLWVLVDTGYLCLFLCFLFKWMLGGPFFAGGGRFCWRGRGRGWVLVDKGCVVPSFVVFV